MDSNELSRYNLTTKQLATLLKVKDQTVRKAYSAKGHYLGLVPVKMPNRFLLWPDDARERLLAGAQTGGLTIEQKSARAQNSKQSSTAKARPVEA